MSASQFDRQRPTAEQGAKPTPVELFSLLKGSEAELEAAACATLGVEHVDDGMPVADYVREMLQIEGLNAAEMLLAVRVADGQHKGRLVWANREPPPAQAAVKRREGAKLPAVSTQRRGQGVGGGVC